MLGESASTIGVELVSSRFPAPTASVAGSDSRPVFMGDDTFTQASIDRLEHELAELTVRLEAATHRQLAILRELEPTGFWAEQGARSFAHWLSWRIGLAPGAAREKLRVARALGGLPAIDAAFAAARLSYSKVRALTRVACAARARSIAAHTMAASSGWSCASMRTIP